MSDALKTYNKIPRSKRSYRFNADGQLRPCDSGFKRALLACLAVAVIAFGAMTFAMKKYLAEDRPDTGQVAVRNQPVIEQNGNDSVKEDRQASNVEAPPEVSQQPSNTWNDLLSPAQTAELNDGIPAPAGSRNPLRRVGSIVVRLSGREATTEGNSGDIRTAELSLTSCPSSGTAPLGRALPC